MVTTHQQVALSGQVSLDLNPSGLEVRLRVSLDINPSGLEVRLQVSLDLNPSGLEVRLQDSQPGHQPQWPGGPPAGGAPNQPAWPTQPGQPSAPGGWPSPSPGPGPGPAPHAPTAPQKSVSMPYNQQLPHGAFDKLLITIIGTVKPNANKFTVDLSASHDLAFHFNPRFNEEGKQAIVRNSMINKKWGREERELGHFPFARGQPFELKIMCSNSEFKVAVNKTHLLEYKHRVRDLKSINRLSINYDVNLSSVQIDRLP
ncbi:galectin-3b [Diretmus argenteus]